MSFSDKKENYEITDFIKIEIPLDNAKQKKWGSWNTTDCLRGLDFRVRNDGYNKYAKKYRWSIEFRNRYRKKVYFSYKAVTPSQKYDIRRTGKTTDRVSVKGNNGKRGSYYLVRSERSIYIYINRIRIGVKDVGRYTDCDK
jgi:hypothetical protein